MRTYVAFALIVFAACKGKPEHRAPPSTVGSAAAVTTGSNGQRAAPDLALPAGPGTPPLKTTRKLGRADFEKMAKLEYPGFDHEQHGLNDVVFEVRQMTKDHPRLWATITIEPCTGAAVPAGSGSGSAVIPASTTDCWPMDLDTWKSHADELKQTWLGVLNGQPEVDWSIGKMNLRGVHMIGMYQLGQHAGSGSAGGIAFTDALLLFYNDGVNRIRVVAEYKDDPVASKDAMAQLAPKSDLEALALSFMDVYTHAWPTN